MARLVETDYRKALEVLYALGEVDGPLPFPTPALHALRELVPCDVVAFHERSWDADRIVVHAGQPIGEMTPEIRAAHRRLKHEDPLRRGDGAQTLSDVISLREFRRSDFYVEVHRPLGVEYMLWLYIDPSRTDARLEFDRAEIDFGERDRKVLELLLPHFRQILRAAWRRGAAASDVGALTERERAVIDLVAVGCTNGEVGRLLGISPQTVRKHLENTYAKLGVHTRTAAVAKLRGHTRSDSI